MKKMLTHVLFLCAVAAAGNFTGEVRASALPEGLYYLEAEVAEQRAD